MSDTSTAADRTVTAFFDTQEHAETAKADLIAAGIAAGDVSVVGSGSDHFTVAQDHHQGFWASLTNWFMPEDDRRVYAEGLRRGGFAVSVRCDGLLYDKAVDVLDRDGAVDLDERAVDWSKEGWSSRPAGEDDVPAGATPYRPADNSTAGFTGSYAGEDGLAVDASQPGLEAVTPAHRTAPTAATDDGVARVTEAENNDVRERIGVGSANWMAPNPTGGPQTYSKSATPEDDAAADAVTGKAPQDPVARRDLEHGRSRVRSYIVDAPVNR